MFLSYSYNHIRINRNIMECKVRFRDISPVACAVLIETLWNVKTLGTLTVNSVAGVLIETLWNVKRAQAKWFDAAKRY